MRVILPLILLVAFNAQAQEKIRVLKRPLDIQIAAHFAPIVYQGLGEDQRADYLTNFDFDGDWKGDNNWVNLDNRSFPLRASVYFSVAETNTHYFIHYAFFHPRDYKGGLSESTILDVLISEGLKRAGQDPTGGIADDLALSHENDLEGCLVVAEKRGSDLNKAIVKFVETMAHNHFLRYCVGEDRAGVCESIVTKGQRPLIFVEPKGHGAMRYTGDRSQLKNAVNGVMIYSYAGRAEESDKAKGKSTGYDLISIYDTFWNHRGSNETYGEFVDYQTRAVFKYRPGKPPEKVEQKFGSMGAAFRGNVGFRNKARPPWAWFDDSERERPRGEWFFDPASVITRHYNLGQDFPNAYVCHPYFNICL